MAHKAFVSSTYEDLKDHRAKVIDSLRKSGFHVDPMEDWTASADEPKNFSRDRLDGCDLCIALIALRRGYVPDGEELSITQLEIQAAESKSVDVLVFMLDEDEPWRGRFDERHTDPEVDRWRAQLLKRYGVQRFGLDPASLDPGPALNRWLRERQDKQASADGSGQQAVALQPVFSKLMKALNADTTTDVLKQLRTVIIDRLTKFGDNADQPPMHRLRAMADAQVIDSEVFAKLEYAITVTSEILYDNPVDEVEVARAIEAAAQAFNRLNLAAQDEPYFTLQKRKDGRPFFSFVLDDRVLFRSEGYQSTASCLNGIRSARSIASRGLIEAKAAKDGRRYFCLVGGNREQVALSNMYSTEDAMNADVEIIRSKAPDASVIERGDGGSG